MNNKNFSHNKKKKKYLYKGSCISIKYKGCVWLNQIK